MESLSIYACQVIAAVLESNSFTKAGQLLNLTPSAVSHTIKKIENTLGYPLFYRYKTGVFMTESGKQLMPFIQSVLTASRILEEEIAKICNTESGIVKVGTFYSAAMYWMPEILKSFKSKHPNITIQLFQSGDAQIIEWIQNFDIDLAILSSDTFDDSAPFTPLYQSPLVCLTPADYAPMDGQHMTPADLEGQPLILQYEGFDTEITSYLKKNKLTTPTNIWVESDNAGFSLVKAGLGSYLSPLMAVGDNVQKLNIYPLLPVTYRSIGILAVSPDHMSPASKLFEEHVIEWVSKLK
ncbi:MAG: LysR family transcriptional regulator [Clostridia bacterium]|nr:LysR family transcriptional regulator [Clostridia bacterium]